MLTGVSSEAFKSAMMHDIVTEDGVSRMVHRAELIVPAGKSLAFTPGALHIMLMGRKRPLRAGQKIGLTLQFKQAPALTVTAPVLYVE